MSDATAVELLTLMRGVPFDGFGRRIDSLAVEGDRLIAAVSPWADSVRRSLGEFEQALKPYQLTDEAHRAMTVAVGIDRLYDLLDELSLTAEPNP